VELAEETSDVRRFRGFGWAALAGALSILVALFSIEGKESVLSPGPLALPHATLICASCHASARATDLCADCHGRHASRRAGHRDLAALGKLSCSTCHGIHRTEHGLAFYEGGRVLFYGPGFESELVSARREPGQSSAERRATAFVPLVAEGACASCHVRDDPEDPARHCFASEPGSRRSDAGFASCFDEHRRSGVASESVPAERDAVVEAARSVARTTELRAPFFAAAFGTGALYVLAGLATTFGVIVFARVRRRAAARAPKSLALAASARRLPVIDATRCLGCEACVDACPYDALEVRRYVALLARPEDCCGAGPCVDACPNASLSLGSDEAPRAGPILNESLECPERPGLFVAGDASGGSLVRNAVRQGVRVAETVAARVERRSASPAVFDLLVVGAGPAGLSAALTAQAQGLSVVVLEQASIAASIRRFSRGKLVLDANPSAEPELPLWLADAPKEQLLRRWLRSVRAARLDVREGERVTSVESGSASGAPFRIRAEAEGSPAREYRSTHVLLALGARGTPRRLPVPVPETLEENIHYELSDARAFADKRVIVVGLGDMAMESALALAAQPGADVSIVHRGPGFRRGKQRNIDAVSGLIARGRVKIWFHAHVERVDGASLVVRSGGESRRLPYDAVFVHIGAIPSHELLARAGVCLRA
jgi:thioredoxin reductase